MKKKNMQLIIGCLSVGLAASMWSADGIFIRPQFYKFPPALVVFWEHFFGAIIMLPFGIKYFQDIRSLQKKDWLAIGWICFLGGFLGTLFITKAFFAAVNLEVSFSTVVILQKLQPIFAILIARLLLREKMGKTFYLWATIAVVATYFIAFGKHGLHWQEIDFSHSAAFFAVMAAFSFGSSTVFGKRVVSDLDFKATTSLRFGFTALIALLYVSITGQIAQTSHFAPSHWLYFGLILCTSGAGAIFLYYYGLKKISASVATLFELFWPLTAILLDYLIYGHTLSPVQLVGCGVLILALSFIVRDRERSLQSQ